MKARLTLTPIGHSELLGGGRVVPTTRGEDSCREASADGHRDAPGRRGTRRTRISEEKHTEQREEVPPTCYLELTMLLVLARLHPVLRCSGSGWEPTVGFRFRRRRRRRRPAAEGVEPVESANGSSLNREFVPLVANEETSLPRIDLKMVAHNNSLSVQYAFILT